LIEQFEFGFRVYHITEKGVGHFTNNLIIASDNGPVSILVPLELRAANDTTGHDISTTDKKIIKKENYSWHANTGQ